MNKEVREELRIRRIHVALETARLCGDVAKACREFNVPRSSYYKWEKAFDVGGIGGLRRRSQLPIAIQENCQKKLLKSLMEKKRFEDR